MLPRCSLPQTGCQSHSRSWKHLKPRLFLEQNVAGVHHHVQETAQLRLQLLRRPPYSPSQYENFLRSCIVIARSFAFRSESDGRWSSRENASLTRIHSRPPKPTVHLPGDVVIRVQMVPLPRPSRCRPCAVLSSS
jgi:hypothetical protein